MRSTRNVVAVMLAAGLLAVAGISGTVYAHGPGGPGGPGFHPGGPGIKPLPSGWAWPSDELHSFVLKSHDPVKPVPSKAPLPTPPVPTCTPAPVSGGSAAPSAAATSATAAGDRSIAAMLLKGQMPGGRDDLAKLMADWRGRYQSEWAKTFCAVDPLRKALDKQISGKIGSLQSLIGQVGKAPGLSSADMASVDGELNSLIADLTALKTKVDAETTLAGLQADLATLNGNGHVYRTVGQWVRVIVGAEKAIAAGPDLVALEATVAGQIAAATPGPEITDAQTFLNDMKLSVTEGEGLAGPIPAALLAITPAQLASGAGDAAIAKANADLFRAMWDLQLARWSAARAQHEIKESTASPAPTEKPKPAASASPI